MSEWIKEISSTGKTYLFNPRTGASKWDINSDEHHGLSTIAKGLRTLPHPLILQIMESMFAQNLEDGSIAINAIINSGYFKLINAMLKNNINMICFMRTRLWLRMVLTMGYNLDDGTFTNEKSLPWDSEIIESQKTAINECQYTSRVHDLLDMFQGNPTKPQRILNFLRITKSRTGAEIGLSRMADLLLWKMYENETDSYGKKFLRGLKRVLPETNETIKTSIVKFMKAINYDSEEESDFIRLLKGGPPKSVNIKYFDVRKVTNMTHLFDCVKRINSTFFQTIDLKYWDTSNVVNMSWMFSEFYGELLNIKFWNTCRVKDMSYMFNLFESWNPSNNLSNWCTSSVEDMSGMFSHSIYFNQDISKWDTSKVKFMSSMFDGARHFNNDISNWNIDNVRSVMGMFWGAIDFQQSVTNGLLTLPRIRIPSATNKYLEINFS